MRALSFVSLCLVAVLGVGCGPPPRMLVTGPLATSPATAITNRPGMFTGTEMPFAPWRATDWHESWRPEELGRYAERFSDFPGEHPFAFTLTRDGAAVRQVGCRGLATVNGTAWTYVVRCGVWDAGGTGETAVLEVDIMSGGELTVWLESEDATYPVSPVTMTDTGRVRPEPYGYSIAAAEGAIAAVQTSNPYQVWMDSSADQELQADCAAALAALVEGYAWSDAHFRAHR